ncbi:MAG: Por secretion system protein [Prevotellaceae bacterium]|nr:Por secretion system protein [Prevotellaceae bacterium]
MRKVHSLITLFLLATVALQAQIVTSTSAFPTENDEVTIIFDATQGTAGLKGYAGEVYAHTGVITDKSKDGSDWKYAPTWLTNTSKYKLTSLGNNKWELKLTPTVRQYYGVAAGETVKQLAFVFRNADGSKEGKDTGGKDIFLPLYTADPTVRLDQPDQNILTLNSAVTIEATASVAATLNLYVGDTKIATASNATSISKSYTFTTTGSYIIKVEATVGSSTLSDSRTVNVLNGTSPQASMPAGVRPGINYRGDTEATLVLQAPGKKYVYVVGDFNDWMPRADYQLSQDGDCFWMTLTGLTKGKEYAFQYLVDGAIYVADPYADKVLDPWNDPYIDATTYPNLKPYPTDKAEGIVAVLQTGQTPYHWQVNDFQRPHSQQLIIYEMLVRDFTAEHTFDAARAKIDYLKTLGVNAVELMPVNEFEGNSSWGYNPSFYFAVDKYYGPKEALKAFVDECHRQGMAVIIDLVLNHSFGQSPFYLLYRDADGKPSADNPWYNQESNIKNPSLSWGYDFNHESKYTQALVDSVAGYWMSQFRIDGFRYDFTKGFSNTPYGVNDWANGPDAARIAILKRMSSEVWKRQPDAYVIFEHLAAQSEEKQLGEAGILLWRNMNNAYCQTAMGYSSDSDFGGLYTGTSMPAGSLVGYMESHDEERTGFKAWKWGVSGVQSGNSGSASPGVGTNTNLAARAKRLATNAAFFLTVPGPKMIWQFGELGYDFSINNNSDGTKYDDGGGYRTDPKPLHWDYYDNADRKKLYDTYAKLLELRRSYPELFAATATFSWNVGVSNWTTGRTLRATAADGARSLVVAGNYTTAAANINTTFSSTGTWYELFNNHEPFLVTAATQSVSVPAHEFRLFTNFLPTPTGIETVTNDTRPSVYYHRDIDQLVIPDGKARRIEIYSINGTVVMTRSNSSSVGLSALPAGYYLARVYLTDGTTEVCRILR